MNHEHEPRPGCGVPVGAHIQQPASDGDALSLLEGLLVSIRWRVAHPHLVTWQQLAADLTALLTLAEVAVRQHAPGPQGWCELCGPVAGSPCGRLLELLGTLDGVRLVDELPKRRL
ncbi:hypothetical protein LI90_4393 (plasmid) [Carbonactinospora thermoautotrophica]|uniref:Uncharacterized protein n=1 Tax=Carbonactinospora thermoautotrophica TaxID=1469144 RepID=A0A132MJ33_9ACTN|nr:hypothetical protein [Carbonactinospora thermoautotrophica]KWW97421.1 hypothetical protein LI90_4393 [Carbonactinospora thermoautotrophica]